jgi:DNA-binding MarR family transcriptional regulator
MKDSLRPPRPDVRPSALLSVLASAHRLQAGIETALEEVGLSMAKVGVLRTLATEGQPLALGELAERNQCVPSNITQLVDRLEADGLVRRESDPKDRRVRRASLTDAGRRAADSGGAIIEAWEQRVAATLGEDATTLQRALDRLDEKR